MSRNKPLPTELPWSWQKSPGWHGQYLRMLRWYSRLDQAKDRHEIEDFLYAFFQNCYHLRDWLRNTDALSKKVLTDFFSSHIELRICQDICNATKHFHLTSSSFEVEFSLAREYVGPARGRFEQDSTLVILASGTKFDVFELAARCLRLWREFLISQNLDTPSK